MTFEDILSTISTSNEGFAEQLDTLPPDYPFFFSFFYKLELSETFLAN